jgi:uncharacterized protein (DUF849 family)
MADAAAPTIQPCHSVRQSWRRQLRPPWRPEPKRCTLIRATPTGSSLLPRPTSAAIRQACPGIAVGVSTGLWITGGDRATRQVLVAEWAGMPVVARPDFASVNLSEPGWPGLCRLLSAVGIAAEAGVWSVADAHELARAGTMANWLRILVEIPDIPAPEAMTLANEIVSCLDDLSVPSPLLLHGEGASCWPLIAQAGKLNLATRVGLEDTLVGPDATAVSGNAEMISLALPIWSEG